MLDDKQIEALKAQHGSAIRIHIPANDYDDEIEIFIKKPPRAEYKRFRAMLFDEAQKPEALETLALACVIYPSVADFKNMLIDRPALGDTVGRKCSEAAGGGGEAQAKKL